MAADPPSAQRHAGQSSVELVALVPAIAVLAVLGWWVASAAHEWVLAGSAARSVVRAQEVGAPSAAALSAGLGPVRRERAAVEAGTTRAGAPRAVVTLRFPRVLPGVPAPAVRGRAATGTRPGEP
jgi:hypothetical protein